MIRATPRAVSYTHLDVYKRQLLVSVGGPIGWMRLSMIGSVMFESIAAGLGTSAVGVQLGTDTLTPEALGMAVWTMILCSIGWALFATFSANKMDKIEKKVSRGNTGTLTTIASCAIIGVFSAMCASHLSKPFYSMMMKADQITMSGSWNKMCIRDSHITAQPLETITRKDANKLRKTYARIEELVKEYDVEKIVLGLPKNMNNTVRCV